MADWLRRSPTRTALNASDRTHRVVVPLRELERVAECATRPSWVIAGRNGSGRLVFT
jgi:hypothetical protein